jgi:hypothetical protein
VAHPASEGSGVEARPEGCDDAENSAGRGPLVWAEPGQLTGACEELTRVPSTGCLLGEQRAGGLTGVSPFSLENHGVGCSAAYGCEHPRGL